MPLPQDHQVNEGKAHKYSALEQQQAIAAPPASSAE